MDLQKDKSESQDIYQTLCNSVSMYNKCLNLECEIIRECVKNTLDLLINDDFHIVAGSAAEGTHLNPKDYGKYFHSTTPCYISDMDFMNILYEVRVIDKGDTLPERFDNYMYCRAERGKHTTEGFRKLRIIYSPEHYSLRQFKENQSANIINMSVEHGYISSSQFLAATESQMRYLQYNKPIKTDFGTQGPSKMLVVGGFSTDNVPCFYVKTWPKEAESWFTRQTHWPDRKLKSKIRKIGYLLVPTGNSQSQESDLEWRCSFSIAEKILFQSMTNSQRCAFVIFKVLLKEFLPSDINTDGEKQLLSTYHMKTLFLWSLEDSQLEWEPEHMLDVIAHMFEKLLSWLKQQYFPHYFIPSVNLLDSRQLNGKGDILIFSISAIRNDLSNKIMKSQFFKGLEINQINVIDVGKYIFYRYIYQCVMKSFTGTLQQSMQYYLLGNNGFKNINSHSIMLEGFIHEKPCIDPDLQHLYRAMYSDPVHDKLLREVMPGLIDQYRGSIHLAKYCMAARDGRVLPVELDAAQSLLKDTLHLEPCSGYVKLACLYIVTGDFVQAMKILDIGEGNFLYTHKNMMTSALRASQWKGVDVGTITKEVCAFIFQKWADGQVNSNIVVTWLECFTVPDLLQFELINESRQYVIDVPHIDATGLYKQVIDVSHITKDEPVKMVGLDFYLQWPPLSMMQLLKFVCEFNSGQSSTSHMENLVTDLIASSLSVTVFDSENDIHAVFNMVAWCYVRIKRYKLAAHMMTVAIDTSSQTDMKRCAFSHHFLAYIIAQCLARGS